VELQFEIAGNQVEGARDYQEDTFLVTHLGEGAEGNSVTLVIVADGMGGHAAGNVASNIATSTFNKTFSGLHPAEDVPGALRQSLLAANDAIRAAVKETPALQGMGCTMVAAFLSRGRLWWVSVGDSHLYLLRDRQLVKKNADHSYGGYIRRMREMGADVEPDPTLSPNMLMSAMIGEEIAEIDLPESPFTLLPGDRVLLASDGLDTLGQGSIIQHSAWSASARDYVSAVLKAIEDVAQPRQDNATIVCIDVKSAEARAEPPRPAEAPRPAPTGDPLEATMPLAQIPVLEPVEAAEAGAELSPAPFPRRSWGDTESRGPEVRRRGGRWALVALAAGALAGGAYLWLQRPPTADIAAARAPQSQPAPLPARPAVSEPESAAPAPAPAQEPSGQDTMAEAKPGPTVPAEPARGMRDPLRSGGHGPELVAVAGGSFEMGGLATALTQDELPKHAVTVAPFAITRHEVTFAEYDRFARATGRRLPASGELDREDHPVTGISWDDALAYTQWLSRETGKRYRLASEAEWEYAARGGTYTFYWWGNEVGKGNAHCFDCKSGLHPRQPARVGYFRPNPYGLHDTAGNVAEWVHDCYHPSYAGAPQDGSVWEGGDCGHRVVRGGSFSSPASALRSASRDRLSATQGYDNVGLRVVREP
jgi:formylglycine-generating enzyme required for sulfatase activity/serine/threonine protein phosphatase PrpC